MAIWNTINLSDIKPDRFDAEYFRKDYQDNIDYLESTGPVHNLGRLFNYINRGSQPAYSVHGKLKALRSVNVGFMNFNETRQEYVTEEFYNNSNRGKVQKDDVLITSTGVGTLGRTSIWFFDDKAYCDGHITILRNGAVDPYLITAFLNSKYGLKQFDQGFRGSSGQIEIYPYDISKFIIPGCLLAYQDEVGNYIRSAFDKAESSKRLYSKASELLKKELKLDKINFEKKNNYTTTFSEVSSAIRLDSNHYQLKFKQLIDHLSNNYKCTTIRHITTVNTRGVQPVYTKNGYVKVVNSKHITKTHLKYDLLESTTTISYQSNPQAHIEKGDILIYTTGAYVGQTNVYLSADKALASNHVNILRLKNNEIDPRYLALVLNTTIGNLQTEKHIRGSAQAELYPNDIAKFIVPILDDIIMKTIGSDIEESLKLSKQSKELLEQAKSRVEQLIEEAATR